MQLFDKFLILKNSFKEFTSVSNSGVPQTKTLML